MPAVSDILRFQRGQLFITPALPKHNLSGKTYAVTGANTGLGLECAKHLAGLHASMLILGCRDIQKGERARELILASKPAESTLAIHVWPIDMCDFSSVKGFAARLDAELPRLDGLLANAGISSRDYAMSEGFESVLTVNVISTFLLSLLTLPKLRQTATSTGVPSHLTITGSGIHCFAADEQLREAPAGNIYSILSDQSNADMPARYFLSKLIVTQCMQAMASSTRKSNKADIIINCPNPGWCKTELFRTDDGGFMGRTMLRLIGRSAEEGARTLTHALVAGPETHGQYLTECQVGPPSVFVRSSEGKLVQNRLWSDLLDILKGISPGVETLVE